MKATHDAQHHRVDLWFRPEGVGRNRSDEFDGRERLHDDRHGSISRLPDAGAQAVAHLTLNCERQRIDARLSPQQVDQERRRDLIRQIRDELQASRSAGLVLAKRVQHVRVDRVFSRQRVAVNQRKPRPLVQTLDEQTVQPAVYLDRDHLRPALEQHFRQRSRPRTDFEHDVIRTDLCRRDQFSHKIQIDEEVLAEAMMRREARAGEQRPDFGQRLTWHSRSLWRKPVSIAMNRAARQTIRAAVKSELETELFGRKKRLTDYATCAG